MTGAIQALSACVTNLAEAVKAPDTGDQVEARSIEPLFKNDEAPPTACVCRSSRSGCGGGWICTSHSLWHVLALLSTVVTTAGTEYVIAVSALLAAAT